jgi:hypothetical protein
MSLKSTLKDKAQSLLSHFPSVERRVLLQRRRHHLYSGRPAWNRILSSAKREWEARQRAPKAGPTILVATSTGATRLATHVDSVLATALALRGADVHVLLCDSALPACFECHSNWYTDQAAFLRDGPQQDLCRDCFEPASDMYRNLGFPVHRYSSYLTTDQIRASEAVTASLSVDDMKDYRVDGLQVGEHALAGALRFFARGDLEGVPNGPSVLRRYLRAAILTTHAVTKLIREEHIDCVVVLHGLYVPQGLVGEVARAERVRVVNWNAAYRKQCFIFSHNDTYHHTLMTEPVDTWEHLPWTPKLDSQLMSYLKSRWWGTEDWISFHESPEIGLENISRDTGIDFSKPCIGMLTNVMWDAQLHYPANAFPNMLTWVLGTIEYFATRPDLQLLIRIHPAEIRSLIPSRQPLAEEIKKAFPTLPANIFVIPPESSISTYALMSKCNSVIIYGTKTGVELTSIGIPVIVAGEAWIRNKGVTMDSETADSYFKLLETLPLNNSMSAETLERARKYAYHFFFRRMIPLEVMAPTGGDVPCKVNIDSIGELAVGRHLGLDIICKGIMENTEFVFPAEDL